MQSSCSSQTSSRGFVTYFQELRFRYPAVLPSSRVSVHHLVVELPITGNSDSDTKSNFFGHSGISPSNHRDIVGQRKWDNPWNVSNVYLSYELLEEV